MRISETVRPQDLEHATLGYVKCNNCNDIVGFHAGGVDADLFGDTEIVIPIAGKLLSMRERLDKTPDGKPMLGFQCSCGNDSRISEAELHHEPASGWRAAALTNAENDRLASDIVACEDKHEPDFDYEAGDGRRYDKFVVQDF